MPKLPRRTRKAASNVKNLAQRKTSSKRRANLVKVLAEVHQLLESYAPAWYTEALKMRIEATLKRS